MKFTYKNLTSQICYEISKRFVEKASSSVNIMLGESKSLVEFVDKIQRMLLERRLSWVYASVLNGVFPDSGFIWSCAVLTSLPPAIQSRILAKWNADFSNATLLSNEDGAIRGVKFIIDGNEAMFTKTGIGVSTGERPSEADQAEVKILEAKQDDREDNESTGFASDAVINHQPKLLNKEEVTRELLK